MWERTVEEYHAVDFTLNRSSMVPAHRRSVAPVFRSKGLSSF